MRNDLPTKAKLRQVLAGLAVAGILGAGLLGCGGGDATENTGEPGLSVEGAGAGDGDAERRGERKRTDRALVKHGVLPVISLDVRLGAAT